MCEFFGPHAHTHLNTRMHTHTPEEQLGAVLVVFCLGNQSQARLGRPSSGLGRKGWAVAKEEKVSQRPLLEWLSLTSSAPPTQLVHPAPLIPPHPSCPPDTPAPPSVPGAVLGSGPVPCPTPPTAGGGRWRAAQGGSLACTSRSGGCAQPAGSCGTSWPQGGPACRAA